MKYYTVCSVKEFEDNGEIKKKYYNVGYIKELEGGTRYLHLDQQPETTFRIFESESEE